MNPFLASYDELAADFRGHDVPIDRPGFCDSEPFLRVEQSLCPEYLNNYAAFVARRKYDSDYLRHAAKAIRDIASILHAELADHGRYALTAIVWGEDNEYHGFAEEGRNALKHLGTMLQ